MKPIYFSIFIFIILFFSSCKTDSNRLSIINSESFNEKQVNLNFLLKKQIEVDSLVFNDRSILQEDQQHLLNQLDEMISMSKLIKKTVSDSAWHILNRNWDELNTKFFNTEKVSFNSNSFVSDSLSNKVFPEAVYKWIELNINLLKLSGEVKFGDSLEKIVYGPEKVFLSEKLLKSVIYTHVDDQIFVNVIGSSSMEYHHTTGGNVRIIQETNYPQVTEMILKSECSDLRYMDIFIRIPSWAINPTVTHGNVKYVAMPGEYCQISRKWKTGDEIKLVLNN